MPMAPKPRARAVAAKQEYEQRRFTAAQRGYGSSWNKAKGPALRQMVVDEADPWCRYCRRNEAKMLDHAIPPTRKHMPGTPEYERLFWESKYWIPACSECNSEKQDMLPAELEKKKPEMHKKLIAVLVARGVTL